MAITYEGTDDAGYDLPNVGNQFEPDLVDLKKSFYDLPTWKKNALAEYMLGELMARDKASAESMIETVRANYTAYVSTT